ncbi:MAG: DNA/RNA nuclease SfsA [Clostridia bacterium]
MIDLGILENGLFVKRLNRFAAIVQINGKETLCHVPNTGRLRELLVEGCMVRVRKALSPLRKTQYDLLLVDHDGQWVAIDSHLANKLVYQGMLDKQLKGFESISSIQKEISYGHSRFDIGVVNQGQPWMIENKCVTLVEDDCAMFPDAPTERGRRHLLELMTAQEDGFKCAVFFIVQRADCLFFRPNGRMDEEFGDFLRRAFHRGLLIRAYKCSITDAVVEIQDEIPVHL